MTSYRVIPSLLLKGGRLVKGTSFSAHRDAGNPATTARAYNAQKADEIVLLDIEAGALGRGPDLDTVSTVAQECQIPITVGGNISSVEQAGECLRRGADKVYVNAAALRRRELISELAHAFGSQAVVLGIDVTGNASDGWALFDYREGASAGRGWLEWLCEAVTDGAGEIRLMAVDREGRRTGLDTELFKAAASAVKVPVILEGGAGSLMQLEQAMREGVEAVAIGTMLVFSDNNIFQVKRHLKNAGLPIRL